MSPSVGHIRDRWTTLRPHPPYPDLELVMYLYTGIPVASTTHWSTNWRTSSLIATPPGDTPGRAVHQPRGGVSLIPAAAVIASGTTVALSWTSAQIQQAPSVEETRVLEPGQEGWPEPAEGWAMGVIFTLPVPVGSEFGSTGFGAGTTPGTGTRAPPC